MRTPWLDGVAAFGGVLIALVGIACLVVLVTLLYAAVVWVGVEEIGQLADLEFREAVGLGFILMVASGTSASAASRD